MRTWENLRSMSELRATLNDISSGIDALCELLDKADSQLVFAGSIHSLLSPLNRQLSSAACDLNDMHL